MLSRPSVTRSSSALTPTVGTANEVAACPPVFTSLYASSRPSPYTANRTVPRPLPTSSSTPTLAANRRQEPPSQTCTAESACAPSPLVQVRPVMESVRPSPAACSPLDRSRSTGPHPFEEASRLRSLIWYVPAARGADSDPARDTRYMTTPCAATLAEIAPPEVAVAPDHRSRRLYEDEPPSPTSAALVLTVLVEPPRLNNTTATDPSDIGLTHTWRPPPRSRTRRPCEPPQSWFTAITSALPMTARVDADMERRSLPRISGALSSAQRLKWERYSVSVIPPLPTSSMSGSLKPLDRANGSSPACWSSSEVMLPHESEMSPVVRHRLAPVDGPNSHGFSWPQLHRLYTIGRPVARRAFPIAWYRAGAGRPRLLQLSYLR